MAQAFRTAREASARFASPERSRHARAVAGPAASPAPSAVTNAMVFDRVVSERDQALERERALRQELEVLRAELGIQQSHGASRRGF